MMMIMMIMMMDIGAGRRYLASSSRPCLSSIVVKDRHQTKLSLSSSQFLKNVVAGVIIVVVVQRCMWSTTWRHAWRAIVRLTVILISFHPSGWIVGVYLGYLEDRDARCLDGRISSSFEVGLVWWVHCNPNCSCPNLLYSNSD